MISRVKRAPSRHPSRVKVSRVRLDNPYATLQEIGDLCTISRERVRQILQKERLPTAARRKACKICGKELGRQNKRGYCLRHEGFGYLSECKDCGGPCARQAKRCRACWLIKLRDGVK